jgi:Tol biopolymer transport system component
MTRFGQSNGTAGYHLRLLTPTITPAAAAGGQPTVTVDAKIVGTVCIAGGKPQMSYNERYLAVHQYTTNTSDIFVTDLKTGTQIQVTKMAAGQHALYPHFRADGWLYFVVRDSNTGKETFVASDVTLERN